MNPNGIKPGDNVKTDDDFLNKTSTVSVLKLNADESQALCGYIGEGLVHKEKWFPTENLTKAK
jgi:hypothetical protein